MFGLSNREVRQPFLFDFEVLLLSIVALRIFSYLWYDYMLTNMNCKTITEKLKRVAAIVDSWNAENGIPQIERDIALGELRDIYNTLLVVDIDALESVENAEEEREVEVEVVFDAPALEEVLAMETATSDVMALDNEETSTEMEASTEVEDSAEQTAPATADVASIEAFYDALDIDALLGLKDEPTVDNTTNNAETVAEPTTEPTADKATEVVFVEEKSAEVAEVAEKADADTTNEVKPEMVSTIAAGGAKLVGAGAAVAASVGTTVAAAVGTTATTVADATVSAAGATATAGTTATAGLFDLNDIPVRSKSRRKMISLYSDNPIPVQSPAEPKVVESAPVKAATPKVESTQVVEPAAAAPMQRLGDSFGEVKTLADKMAKDDAPTTPFNRITELRQAIGLNDKFLMIRDLFGGDATRYEATIDTLDEFDDLDECIIYIVENFRWNPDLEATKLLVSLIERKLA